ncbi:RICIN domain-containing protein [Streptomyces sp. NY05-11A]|uniref:RICIN domain-containing protein n=1 Tax=Streptomyces soliscabiei TaxID=588897 RepID=UPI003B9AB65B
MVNALKPNTFVQMAPGGSQLPNGEPKPAGDALVVAPKAARAGAKAVVRMPDWYPNFPYQWVSWADWLSAVASDGYHLVITPNGASTSLAGRYQITNKNSGLALDTVNAGTAQGTSVVQSTSTTGTDQNWTLVAAGSGLYKIVNQKSGLLLGINNMSTADGGTALIRGDNGTADHLGQLVPARDGFYKIANYNGGLLLGVNAMSTSSGAQVLQWTDNGTADHLWKLTAR